MKRSYRFLSALAAVIFAFSGCSQNTQPEVQTEASSVSSESSSGSTSESKFSNTSGTTSENTSGNTSEGSSGSRS
ncbi:MAG: hypothetical protein IK093_09320, partial [Ruminiclostridium sp.]|nr:hypothetical protein [Ruminiclostridium sp.]